MQLVSTNLSGNLHQATSTINAMGLAEFVLAMDCPHGGSNTVVVFRVSDDMGPELRKYFRVLPEYVANPKPDRSWTHR